MKNRDIWRAIADALCFTEEKENGGYGGFTCGLTTGSAAPTTVGSHKGLVLPTFSFTGPVYTFLESINART